MLYIGPLHILLNENYFHALLPSTDKCFCTVNGHTYSYTTRFNNVFVQAYVMNGTRQIVVIEQH